MTGTASWRDVPMLSGEQAASYDGAIEMWKDAGAPWRITIGRADPRARFPRLLALELSDPSHPYGDVDITARRAEIRDDAGRQFVYRIDGRCPETNDLFVAWPD